MVYLFKKIKKEKTYYSLGKSKRIDGKVRRIWQKYLGPASQFAEQLHEGLVPREIEVLEFGLCSEILNISNNLTLTVY